MESHAFFWIGKNGGVWASFIEKNSLFSTKFEIGDGFQTGFQVSELPNGAKPYKEFTSAWVKEMDKKEFMLLAGITKAK